jgi:hypothetical protein
MGRLAKNILETQANPVVMARNNTWILYFVKVLLALKHLCVELALFHSSMIAINRPLDGAPDA